MATLIAGAIIKGLGVTSFWATTAIHLTTALATAAVSQAIRGGGSSGASQSRAEAPGVRQKFTGKGDTSPQSFMLGRYATAGHQFAPVYCHSAQAPSYGTIGSGDYATFLINLSDVPIEALEGVYVNGVYFELATHLDGTPHAQYGLSVASGEDRDDWVGKLWVKFYDGTQTFADPYLRAAYGNHPVDGRAWKSTSVHRGAAYAIVTAKRDDTLFRGNLEFKFVTRGIKLLDPRTDATVYSENPIVMIYNIMVGITLPDGQVYGLGVDPGDLPSAWWHAAMDVCDTQVDKQGGGTETQYRAGYEVKMGTATDGGDDPLTVIDALLPSCAGQIADVGGTWIIRAGAPALTSLSITDDDVLNSEERSFRPFEGLAQTINCVTAVFPNPDAKWEPTEAPARYNLTAEAEDGRRLPANLDLKSAPYADQVQRLTVAFEADAQRRRGHSTALPPRYDQVTVLDTIAFSSALHRYTNKAFEVQSLRIGLQTGVVSQTLREVDRSDWTPSAANYISAPVVKVTRGRSPTLTLAGFGAEAFTVTDAVRARRAGGRLYWSSAGQGLKGFAWQVRIQGEMDVLEGAVANPEATDVILLEGLLPDVTYEARARPIADAYPTAWSNWQSFTTDDVGITTDDLTDEVVTTEKIVDEAVNEFRDYEGAGTLTQAITRIFDTQNNVSIVWSVTIPAQTRNNSAGGHSDHWTHHKLAMFIDGVEVEELMSVDRPFLGGFSSYSAQTFSGRNQYTDRAFAGAEKRFELRWQAYHAPASPLAPAALGTADLEMNTHEIKR